MKYFFRKKGHKFTIFEKMRTLVDGLTAGFFQYFNAAEWPGRGSIYYYYYYYYYYYIIIAITIITIVIILITIVIIIVMLNLTLTNICHC